MRVFISCSGRRSTALAVLVHQWLGTIVQRSSPWMADLDMSAGQRWNEEVSTRLQDTQFGILCLTPENLGSAWLLFEAGALAKAMNASRVVPLLLGLRKTDVAYPLAQFHSVEATEAGFRALAVSVNESVDKPLAAATLERLHARLWPELQTAIQAIPPTPKPDEQSIRTDRQLLEQLTQGMQSVQRALASGRPILDIEGAQDAWQDYYMRAVNLASARYDESTNKQALLAITGAIALLPPTASDNQRSRVYCYRAAMLKRLNRLEEAAQDLVLAQRWAREPREIEDALYNLACVLAMGPEPESALPKIRELVTQNGVWREVLRDRTQYFGKLFVHPEFRELVALT